MSDWTPKHPDPCVCAECVHPNYREPEPEPAPEPKGSLGRAWYGTVDEVSGWHLDHFLDLMRSHLDPSGHFHLTREQIRIARFFMERLEASRRRKEDSCPEWRVLVNDEGEPYAVEKNGSRLAIDTNLKVAPRRSKL